MKKLRFEKLTDVSELFDFYCGIDTIDTFLHGDFQDYLYLGICQAYVIKDDGVVIAMYSLDKFNVFISDEVKTKMQDGIKPIPPDALDPNNPYWRLPLIDSVEITYLAVAQNRQHEHIGSFIIEKIIKDLLKDESCTSPLLTVRAYKSKTYTAVPFYEKCGFHPTEEFSEVKPTLCMYRIIA